MEFRKWGKIPRWENTTYLLTEKIDGTNACIAIGTDGYIHAQSRRKIITPKDDNHGFAKWVEDNKEELLNSLPTGYHFGEWWGKGIQRGYGIEDKKFSLFNTRMNIENVPSCVCTVPLIAVCDHANIETVLYYEADYMRKMGSYAALSC